MTPNRKIALENVLRHGIEVWLKHSMEHGKTYVTSAIFISIGVSTRKDVEIYAVNDVLVLFILFNKLSDYICANGR